MLVSNSTLLLRNNYLTTFQQRKPSFTRLWRPPFNGYLPQVSWWRSCSLFLVRQLVCFERMTCLFESKLCIRSATKFYINSGQNTINRNKLTKNWKRLRENYDAFKLINVLLGNKLPTISSPGQAHFLHLSCSGIFMKFYESDMIMHARLAYLATVIFAVNILLKHKRFLLKYSWLSWRQICDLKTRWFPFVLLLLI